MSDAIIGSGKIGFGKTRWPLLVAGTLGAIVGGLSTHVFLQDGLHVPYPAAYPSQSVVEQIDQATIILGLLLLLSVPATKLRRLKFTARGCVLFLIYALLQETLRKALMEGVVTTAYAYPLFALIPKLLGLLLTSLLCVAAAPRIPRFWHKALAAGLLYTCIAFAVQPFLNSLFAAPLSHFEHLRHAPVYMPPYGVHVLIPAYLTFIEPAIGAVLCAALVWRGLSRQRRPYATFVLLILLIRRSLFPPFIYAFFQPEHPLRAFASAGQFTLETVVLGVLSALTVNYALAGDLVLGETVSPGSSGA